MSGEHNIDRPFCERIDQVDAQAEIDRLLTDPLFQSPERNKSFLRFIASEFFEGRAEAIKAYAIAVDVFGRPANFDPSIDPIVRIEATRLRAALTQYYDVHGSDTGIRVDLPRGRYVPVFTRMAPNDRSSLPAEAAEPDVPDHAASVEESSNRRFLGRSTGLALTWLLVGFGIATYALTMGLDAWRQNALKHKPLISIALNGDGDAPEREVEKVRDYLMVAISQFQTIRLASPDDRPAMASVGEWTGPTLVSALRGQRTADDYRIALKYEGKGRDSSVWWQVRDASTGEVLQSGIEPTPQPGTDSSSPSWNLANGLARTLVGTRGVINTIETLRELGAPSLGNGCILRAIAASDQGDEAGIMDARSCLERTLAIAPNDPGAKAELAIVLLALDSVDDPTDLSAHAQRLAGDAVKRSPFSDRSRYALMISQFRAGQIQAAIETGYVAMELNPNNSDVAARLGLYLFTAGRWEEGADLAARSAQMDRNGVSDGLLTRALDAYRLGRFEDALALSQQLKLSDDYAANAVQAAAAGHLGTAENARMALERLGAGRADFNVIFRKSMSARHFTPEMSDLLEIGVLKATAQKS
ncbi:tetratricopeptide repeat protein [Rhizobium herbae]